MAKEKITVTLAGVKMNLITADKEAVLRMAASLDTAINKIIAKTKCPPENALVMVAMEQCDSLKKNAELIYNQQQQIFVLQQKNSALADAAADAAPVDSTENVLLHENARLKIKNEELLDEILRLRKVTAE